MGVPVNFRFISYSNEIVKGEPILVSSNCLPVKAFNFEPAGHAFHFAVLRLLGYCVIGDDDNIADKLQGVKIETHVSEPDSYNTKDKKKLKGEGKQHDHYALLGLSHLRYLATEEQIRKGYRETALKYHPDKQAAILLAEATEAAKLIKKEKIETHFKLIQEAYEVLIDPSKRRIYDSTDEFDDEIPTECSPKDFFKVFGPAFMRNGRWSMNQPVLLLGDESSSIDEVDKFYDFWYTFKSWREFPQDDEFDVEQAESRDHKRWMERQNAKLSEKARKEEYLRIRSLVDSAYKRDPRVLRRKEELKAEKIKKKQSKYLVKKLEEEEAARIAEEERRQKEEEERKAAETALHLKKLKEKEKKMLRKERTRLRTLSWHVITSKEVYFPINEDDVQNLCISLEFEALRSLCDKIEGKDVSETARILEDACQFKKIPNGNQPAENNVQRNGCAFEVKANGSVILNTLPQIKERSWGKEEIELLRKAVQKYPKGTSRRWEVISEFIGTKRSVEEILKATKTVLLQKPDSAKSFDSFLEKRKGAKTIASPLSTRVEASSATDTKDGSEEEKSENAAMADTDTEVWSAIQERALVQALKTFPKETNRRWERVATSVPGKSMNQCKKKFASMKDKFRSKRNGDAS